MKQLLNQELEREFALVRVAASGFDQDRALGVVGRWSARLLKLSPDAFTVELSELPSRLDEFISAVQPFGEVKVTRSGTLKLA